MISLFVVVAEKSEKILCFPVSSWRLVVVVMVLRVAFK